MGLILRLEESRDSKRLRQWRFKRFQVFIHRIGLQTTQLSPSQKD